MPTGYDFHAWVVSAKGDICDMDTSRPSLKADYELISMLRHGHKDFTFVHKEWKETPKHVKKVREELSGHIRGLPLSFTWNELKDVHGMCHQRAIIIQIKNPSARIVYGSLGLKSNRTGEVWWEHGNGSPNYKKRPVHSLKWLR